MPGCEGLQGCSQLFQAGQRHTLSVLILGVWLIIETRVVRPSRVEQLLASRSSGLSDRSRYVILDCGPKAWTNGADEGVGGPGCEGPPTR